MPREPREPREQREQQKEVNTGREEFARVWMHGEFLNIRGEKMSKRFGNVTTAGSLTVTPRDGDHPNILSSNIHPALGMDVLLMRRFI